MVIFTSSKCVPLPKARTVMTPAPGPTFTWPAESTVHPRALPMILNFGVTPLGRVSQVTRTVACCQVPDLGLGGDAMIVDGEAVALKNAGAPVYGLDAVPLPATTSKVAFPVSVRVCAVSVNCFCCPDGNDLALRCWVMLKPAGRPLLGDGLEALVTKSPMSTPALPMSTLSGLFIVPEESRNQPTDPAAFADTVKVPPEKGAGTFSESKCSLMLALCSPATEPDAGVNVCTNAPP